MTEKKESQAPIWLWVLIGIIPLIYWFSFGPFIRWETSASARKQYHARVMLGQSIYAPIAWLERHDPTRAVSKLDLWLMTPWIKIGFSYTDLPEE